MDYLEFIDVDLNASWYVDSCMKVL